MQSARERKPVLTYTFMALCVLFTVRFYYLCIAAIFAAESGRRQFDALAFFHSSGIGFIPKYGFDSLFPWVTSLFYHSSPEHVIGNALSLWFFGRSAERQLSSLKYAELFFVCGFLGHLFTLLFHRFSETPGLGASGAIMGLIVFYFLTSLSEDSALGSRRGWKTYWPVLILSVLYILPNFVLGVAQSRGMDVGNTGYIHHAGGALGGWLYFKFLDRPIPLSCVAKPELRSAPSRRRVS